MRGSVSYQVNQVYERSGANCIGQSRHHAKESARAVGARTSAEVARETGVYSFSTADQYRNVWRGCLQYAKENGQPDVEEMSSEHIQGFLESKIDKGVSRATYNSYVSALRKFQDALNRIDNDKGYDFEPGIEAASVLRNELRKFEGSRAYEDPEALIEAIPDVHHKLAARLQFEGGCRRDELATVRQANLRGDGQFDVRGKGGKIRRITVSDKTYDQFSQLLMRESQMPMHKQTYYSGYLASLKKAAAESGQNYTGSHGLRWNFAQNRMKRFQREGGSYEGGLLQVSRDMGHERAEITEHYLR